MKCHNCDYPETEVRDSRAMFEGYCIRRRRLCTKCNSRFTTYEVTKKYTDAAKQLVKFAQRVDSLFSIKQNALNFCNIVLNWGRDDH